MGQYSGPPEVPKRLMILAPWCADTVHAARRRDPLRRYLCHGPRTRLPTISLSDYLRKGKAVSRDGHALYTKGPIRFMSALPPATVEGWYSLHQAFEIDYAALRRLSRDDRAAVAEEARALFLEIAIPPTEQGWSAAYRVVGGGADVLFVHFRSSIDELNDLEMRIKRCLLGDFLTLRYDYLAVTEAGLYHATADVAKQFEPNSADYQRALAAEAEAEAASPHVRTRLYPVPPEEMRYLSFYPMTKRRSHDDNWYVLDVDQRNQLMREHGLTGRRYAGRVFQVISGSIGLDDWEWGVSLFARDPLEFKRIVTEMRYDEASARYGEFGRFFTGVRLDAEEWPRLLSL